jgi:hypothetical protein
VVLIGRIGALGRGGMVLRSTVTLYGG